MRCSGLCVASSVSVSLVCGWVCTVDHRIPANLGVGEEHPAGAEVLVSGDCGGMVRGWLMSVWTVLCRNHMNDSLRTNVFVRFTPETIACACIFLSARQLRVSLDTFEVTDDCIPSPLPSPADFSSSEATMVDCV